MLNLIFPAFSVGAAPSFPAGFCSSACFFSPLRLSGKALRYRMTGRAPRDVSVPILPSKHAHMLFSPHPRALHSSLLWELPTRECFGFKDAQAEVPGASSFSGSL